MVKVSGAGLIVNVYCLDPSWGVGEKESVTVKVCVRLLATVWVPLIVPVEVLKTRPLGNAGFTVHPV